MLMEEVLRVWRKQFLSEANEPGSTRFYMTPEDQNSDYPAGSTRSGGPKHAHGKINSKQHKSFLSFNSDASDYKIEGATHGKISHMIKHFWEFGGDKKARYVESVLRLQAEIRDYIKKTDSDSSLPKLYYHNGKRGTSQVLSYEGNESFEGARHPEAPSTTSGPIISNTLDYIQDKYHHPASGQLQHKEVDWLEGYAKPLTAMYDQTIQDYISGAIVLADYLDPKDKKFIEGGAKE